MAQLRDPHPLRIGINADQNPSELLPGEVSDALNVRLGGSDQEHGEGPAETLQSEIELLINPDTLLLYYGFAIGGQFIYSGYDTVVIGTQTWMRKNYDANYPGRRSYGDDEDNRIIYGSLYSHDQIMQDDFCPSGWHVPTYAEVETLLTYLGGEMLAGGNLKEVGDSHWADPNLGAQDTKGFRALPAGKFDTVFDLLGLNGLIWLADDGAPLAPMALNASNITYNSFIANWTAADGATGYRLDVSLYADFHTLVMGYNNKDIPNSVPYGSVLFAAVTGLTKVTNYYYRVRAYNEVGTSDNSNTTILQTYNTASPSYPIMDKDGNVYTTVIIGDQEWIVENLKVTTFADGTPIPNLPSAVDWAADVTGAYCWYNNDISNKTPYGALYNAYAVDNTHGLAYFERGGVQELGWRVQTKTDRDNLIAYLDGIGIAGGKLKEVGVDHWTTPNTGATDEVGFKAIGGGYRYYADGSFYAFGTFSIFWTSTPHPEIPDLNFHEMYYLRNNSTIVTEGVWAGDNGFSVRCVRDINIIIDDDMKYLQTFDISAGVTTTVTTPLTSEPYNVFLIDSDGNDITSLVGIGLALVGGVYVIYIDSLEAYTGVKLKIIY